MDLARSAQDMVTLHCLLRQLFRRFHEEYDLPPRSRSQRGALMVLHKLGCATLSEVCREMGMKKGSFPRVVQPLVDEGYVRRAQRAGDKRKVDLSLTRAGEQAVQQLYCAFAAFIRELFGGLPSEQAQPMLDALHTLAQYPHGALHAYEGERSQLL